MATEKVVKRKDLVTVYGTGSSKHMPQGMEVKVHSIAAENLIKKGYAQKEKIGAASEGKKGGKGGKAE